MKKKLNNAEELTKQQKSTIGRLTSNGWTVITLNSYIRFLDDGGVELQHDNDGRSIIVRKDGTYTF